MSATDPWRGLPDELKVKILEYTLDIYEPKNIYERKDLYDMSSLGPLLLTSKRMGNLALETWGKSYFRIWSSMSRRRMPKIDPQFGKFVRKLSISISLHDRLVWHDADIDTKQVPYMQVPFEIRGYPGTPWRVLLSCKSDRQSPLSEWQAALPNLSELEVQVDLQSEHALHLRNLGRLSVLLHSQDIEGFLAQASCNLRANRVSVSVFNTYCGDVNESGCPKQFAKRLAMGVKALIEQNKS